MSYDIGPKIGIEGEAEFRKSLREITSSMKTMGAQMDAVSSAYAKNDKSQEKLTQQNEVLNKQISMQKEKLEQLSAMLERSRVKYGEADEKTQKWQKSVYAATADLNRMERQLDDNTAAMNDTGDATDDMGDSLDDAGGKATTFGSVLSANMVSDVLLAGVQKLATGFAELGAQMMTLGTDFEQSMAKTSTLFGDVKVDTAGLNDKVLKLSNSTGLAAKEIGGSL